jgi:hypothetical protein
MNSENASIPDLACSELSVSKTLLKMASSNPDFWAILFSVFDVPERTLFDT